MEIEFDAAKNATNKAKHGLSLADGALIFDDKGHYVLPSIREIDGEERFKVTGMMSGRLHTAVFVGAGGASALFR